MSLEIYYNFWKRPSVFLFPLELHSEVLFHLCGHVIFEFRYEFAIDVAQSIMAGAIDFDQSSLGCRGLEEVSNRTKLRTL